MCVEFYGAGNFVLMSDPKKEQKFVEEVIKKSGKCNRLISFFFKKELETVMSVKNIGHFDVSINGKIVGKNLTMEAAWAKIDEYGVGATYVVYDSNMGGVIEDFIPF